MSLGETPRHSLAMAARAQETVVVTQHRVVFDLRLPLAKTETGTDLPQRSPEICFATYKRATELHQVQPETAIAFLVDILGACDTWSADQHDERHWLLLLLFEYTKDNIYLANKSQFAETRLLQLSQSNELAQILTLLMEAGLAVRTNYNFDCQRAFARLATAETLLRHGVALEYAHALLFRIRLQRTQLFLKMAEAARNGGCAHLQEAKHLLEKLNLWIPSIEPSSLEKPTLEQQLLQVEMARLAQVAAVCFERDQYINQLELAQEIGALLNRAKQQGEMAVKVENHGAMYYQHMLKYLFLALQQMIEHEAALSARSLSELLDFAWVVFQQRFLVEKKLKND